MPGCRCRIRIGHEKGTKISWKQIKILRTASAVEAVKCLAEIWEQTKGWE